jgi:hypothetical protein
MLDVKWLIGEVAARNGIRVESWDPAFALVTLNELVLEEIARRLTEEVHSGIAEFTEAVQKTEARVAVIRWGAAGLIAGAGLFGSGLWIGAHYFH